MAATVHRSMLAMEARQLVPGSSDDGRTSSGRLCQSVSLPANGVLRMPDGELITLSGPASFYKPACSVHTQPAIIAGAGENGISVDETAPIGGPNYSDLRDPFYASIFPQCYALAATTIIAYTLVIMLVITPRSFLDGGVVVLGRRGFTSGGTVSGTIGGRPWLQKVAALTVAISLTIATADTFRVAEEQYAFGLQDAQELQERVLGGTELKIIRIISDTFLWLAQAQTLIRLFPRQREKVIIKWTAFALITFDLIFDSLNSFQYAGPGNTRPGSFTDAIPALSYLFQLALGVLYAAWVIYYSLMKKRYAYYHPLMKNICLVAVLSLLAILVPVVFFILDISKSEFTGWGDYVRWVGAAAASVIVWEWVERIEALEREEKRDGILGREVFDGDEMLESASDSTWPRRHRTGKDDEMGQPDDGGEGGDHGEGAKMPTTSGRSNMWPSMSTFTNRYRSRSNAPSDRAADEANSGRQAVGPNRPTAKFLQPPLWPSRPPPAVSPVSRTDTASADSTVYAIRYHPLTETTSRTTTRPTPPPMQFASEQANSSEQTSEPSSQSPSMPLSCSPQPHQSSSPRRVQDLSRSAESAPPETRPTRNNSLATPQRGAIEAHSGAVDEPSNDSSATAEVTIESNENSSARRWRVLAQAIPFLRPLRPGTEVAEAKALSRLQPYRHGHGPSGVQADRQTSRWDLRTRMEDFAATQAERIRERIRPTPDTASLPVTVIPAPPRRGAALAHVLEEESQQTQARAHAHAHTQALVPHGSHETWAPSSPISPMHPRRNSTGSTTSLTMARLEGTSQTSPTLDGIPPFIITAASRRASSTQDAPDNGPPVP